MATAVKEEVFEITRNTTGISENDLAAVTVDDSLQIVWEYPVPTGYALVFTSEDTLSAYLEDDDNPDECIDATVFVDVVVMDSSRQNVRTIMGVCQYGNIVDFAETNKLKHMDITPGEQIIANEGERVCIRANSKTSSEATLDASDSYFRLTCKRIRHSLF